MQSTSTKPMSPESEMYFSVDVETDGPIPGPFSMLSFAVVYAGEFDGEKFYCPQEYDNIFYKELKPISDNYQQEALDINKLDRRKLQNEGDDPSTVMNLAFDWIKKTAGNQKPILVAFPVSFDWSWLYWYFTLYCDRGSPFGHSNFFDIKTALATKRNLLISNSSRSKLPPNLQSKRLHTHHAIDDAVAQAQIFANVFKMDKIS